MGPTDVQHESLARMKRIARGSTTTLTTIRIFAPQPTVPFDRWVIAMRRGDYVWQANGVTLREVVDLWRHARRFGAFECNEGTDEPR